MDYLVNVTSDESLDPKDVVYGAGAVTKEQFLSHETDFLTTVSALEKAQAEKKKEAEMWKNQADGHYGSGLRGQDLTNSNINDLVYRPQPAFPYQRGGCPNCGYCKSCGRSDTPRPTITWGVNATKYEGGATCDASPRLDHNGSAY